MTTGERRGSCPYAVSIDDDEQSHSSSENMGDILEQARKSCPAFDQGSCPFSAATSVTQVRQTLSKIPSSHYVEDYFRQVMQHLHKIAPDVQSDEFRMNECPVQPFNREHSIYDALEGASLAAIMSRVARHVLDEDGDGFSDDDGENEEKNNKGKEARESEKNSLRSGKVSSGTLRRKSELSTAFKKGTTASHQAAEDVHFVKNFIQGIIDRDLYADLVVSLFHVYKALEEELDKHASKSFGACHFPDELNRRASLGEDLDFWRGESEPSYISPATRDYVHRIHHIAQKDPLLLLSHAYTRYLGDLSGGKILRRVAKRAMDLDNDGLAFYDFPKIKSAKLFKDKYRSCLDGLELTQEQVAKLVTEANIAFILNMRIFEELDVKANVPGARVRELSEAFAIASNEPQKQAGEEACPFLQNKKQQQQKSLGLTESKRCPWPFIFAHDPVTGMKDIQTWIVFGIALAWMWSRVV